GPRTGPLLGGPWGRGLPLAACPRGDDAQLPARLRAALPEIRARFESLVSVRAEHRGADGAVRFLLALANGDTIESVLLPGDGVCISTQVGCAVGCIFCMTGKSGLTRSLSSEIG